MKLVGNDFQRSFLRLFITWISYLKKEYRSYYIHDFNVMNVLENLFDYWQNGMVV